MRARLHRMLIGALLVPALVASGAVQGMLLMRCGPAMRVSCCCPGQKAQAPVSSIEPEKPKCCDTVAIPAGPVQAGHEQATPTPQPTPLVAVLGRTTAIEILADRARNVRRLDPPPGRS